SAATGAETGADTGTDSGTEAETDTRTAAEADGVDAEDGGGAGGGLAALLSDATDVLRSSGPGQQDRPGDGGAAAATAGSAGGTGGGRDTATSAGRGRVAPAGADLATEREPETLVGEADDLDTFEAARRFVEREREAEREAVRGRFAAMDPGAYCARHEGVEHARAAGRWHDEELGQVCGLVVTDAAGEARSGVDLPGDCGIYPGDEVLVDARRDGEGLPVEAEVLAVEGAELHLGVYWDTAADRSRAEGAFEMGREADLAVAKLLNPTPHDRLLDGIRDCEDDERTAAVVRGDREPAYGDPVDLGARSTGLNEYQTAAVEDALAAEDVHIVHGPPGTGKTRTLVAVVREAVERGDRVLAVAHSNQAVDNLLVGGSTRTWTDPRSLHASAEAGDLSLARAGENSSNDLVAHRYADASTWQADVVGATTSGSHRFVPGGFDLVVVDEAAQASVASTLLAVSRAERAVLAGDHRQLPPYTAADGEHPVASSLFERLVALYGEDAATFLARQYRMHEAIASFPNRAFYGGRLEHGEDNRDWTVRDLAPVVGRQVDGTEAETPGTSLYNAAEARAVAREVSTLLRNGLAPKDVGVVTPYAGQASKITGALAELDREGLAEEVTVDTVDSFQGGERTAVVLSLVRANDDGDVGFLATPGDGPRRLNVALTRAQKRLVVVADWETVGAARGEGAWALRALAADLRERGLVE
ncbi:MAG: AAA domain-containing protein, partial [Halobacteriaceae archaeon]